MKDYKKNRMKHKKRKLRIIEIKTNAKGWYRVRLVKINKGSMTIKLPDGQIINRKIKHVRWGIIKRVVSTVKQYNAKKYKYLRSKKKRRKGYKGA